MGERQAFQPLTREDRITVVIYRTGIVLSTLVLSALAVLLTAASSVPGAPTTLPATDVLAYALYASIGMSVFFIHLYVGSFKKFLTGLYLVSLGCLVVLLVIGKGSLSGALQRSSYSPLLLLPLSGCLGFVTAKEAFCFRLFEGYLLAMIMPACLLLASGGMLTGRGSSIALVLVAALLVLFTLRKVFMPIAYDIGDKTAYR